MGKKLTHSPGSRDAWQKGAGYDGTEKTTRGVSILDLRLVDTSPEAKITEERKRRK